MSSVKGYRLFITCEHGGNEVPDEFNNDFTGQEKLLDSHRGWDPGALETAIKIADTFHAPLEYSTVTRLLVDLNRSIGSPTLFSEISRQFPKEAKETILRKYYYPMRNRAETVMKEWIDRREKVLHLAVHSFTPVYHGKTRTTDIGLLYDWRDPAEKEWSVNWKKKLITLLSGYKIHLNRPYTGVSDGFQTYLKKQFPPGSYLGITLEINHKFFYEGKIGKIGEWLTEAFQQLMN